MSVKRGRGRPKKVDFKELLDKVLPVSDLFTEEEIVVYDGLIDVYLQDFTTTELSANDIDDVMTMATNKIFERRLLKESKNNPTQQISIATAIDKLRGQTNKLKENLASRRKDRIDPKRTTGLSIVDLVVEFNERKSEVHKDKLKKLKRLKKEEDEIKKSDLLIGNKNDADANLIGK